MESTGVYWKPVWNVLEEHFHMRLPTLSTSRRSQAVRPT
jgi:hypothetical protein